MKQFHSAYELIKEEELSDISSKGYLLRHKKTKAMISIIKNYDNNKVFYISFKTLPKDSTGVMHILEHSVLCGSKKYPLKDPFVELVKGSLNTFLNAFTYQDKTVYPIASINDKDFKNLMDVYLDAVFNPNIFKHKEIFLQEGWHYELPKKEDDIKINGIVYNEMKGAYSSPDEVMDRKIISTLLPDTIYSYESGGDPDIIPTLTREEFLYTYDKYYHPSNAYIYMYGDIDIEERLSYLDREYLSKYSYREIKNDIDLHKDFTEEKEIEDIYSINSNEDPTNKSYLSKSYVIGTFDEKKLMTSFEILSDVLLSMPGAVLEEAFIKSEIAEDVMGGFYGMLKEGIFSIILKNTSSKDKDKFLDILNSTLKDIVKNGIDKDMLLASIESNKFRFLEADFGSYPKGLVYGLSLFNTWLYDKYDPFSSLHIMDILNELEKEIDKGYFEGLIDKYLLNNKNAAIIDLKAVPGLTVKRDKTLQEKLKQYKNSLTEDEIEKMVEDTRSLKAFQDEKPKKEDLQKMPFLTLEDLERKARPLINEIKVENGIKILHTDMDTKIHYLDIKLFPEKISEDLIKDLSFYTKLLGMVDTKDYTYKKLSVEKNKYTGGINFQVDLYQKEDSDIRLCFTIKAKTLYENEDKLTSLIKEILYNTILTDKKRIKEILLKNKSYLEEELISNGHSFSLKRAFSYLSNYGKVRDELSGIAYFYYLKDFLKDFDRYYDKFIENISTIRDQLFRRNNVIISVVGNSKSYSYAKKVGECLFKDQKEGLDEKLFGQISFNKNDKQNINEGFKTPSQVQYVCMAGNFKKMGYKYNGAMNILESILGYDYFWHNLRVKGGSYGCMSGFFRKGNVYFVSYRDPNLKDTLYVYINTYNYLKDFDVDRDTMTKYIIGAIGSLDTPLTPRNMGERNINFYLSGITYKDLQRERDEILDATKEDIRKIAPLIKDVIDNSYICVIGNEDKIEKYKDVFDTVRTLI